MKLGGLFSGVGGFELAWTQLGHEVAWMCEWDPKARKVLEARFPGVPIYPDVRDLDPAEVEPVDVLTGGSPCQGFSVAGTRSGLEHSESQLFRDYVRIMDGLAVRGLKYAVWENVPGVLSIVDDDGERTFEHVVSALAGGTVPVRLPRDRRWNTGLASGRGRAVAWRVLDSRYFGVAQRRRRLFACVAFGDSAEDRAGRTLLAVSEGARGDSAAGGSSGKEAAGSVAVRAGVPSVAGTLNAGAHPGSYNGQDAFNDLLFPDSPAYGMYGGSGREGATFQEQPAITASHGQPGNVAQAFRKSRRAQSDTDDETWVDDGGANTLNVFDTGDTRTTHAIVEPWSFSAGNSARARSMGEEQGIAPPVRAGDSGSVRSPTIAGPDYGVRRLTPVECERLQSFPDGWTEPAGSDSARYKAMGNAVTVNVVRWILGRLP